MTLSDTHSLPFLSPLAPIQILSTAAGFENEKDVKKAHLSRHARSYALFSSHREKGENGLPVIRGEWVSLGTVAHRDAPGIRVGRSATTATLTVLSLGTFFGNRSRKEALSVRNLGLK